MVLESEVLKAQSCALSKLSLPMHSNVPTMSYPGYLVKILPLSCHDPDERSMYPDLP